MLVKYFNKVQSLALYNQNNRVIYNFAVQKFNKKNKDTDINEQQDSQKQVMTKKEQRLQKDKEFLDQVNNLETVAEQKELTIEKLKDLVERRKQQVLEISEQKQIPTDALLTYAIFTAPIVIGPVLLNYMCFSGSMVEHVPKLAAIFAKYTALHISFGAGIHWGFAMSLHDQQFDSIRSSFEAKRHFLLSVLPIFSSISMVNTLAYQEAPIELKLTSIGVFSLMYVYNLYLDRRVVSGKQAPQWFFTLKSIVTLVSLAGMAGYALLYQNYFELSQQKNYDPLRQHIPNKDQLLSSSLKLSEQEKMEQEEKGGQKNEKK
ncbi:hypothetical protein PPERSA_03694 [Pseudocohnilembus persalinus]|uniref:Transmembrane protein n=1 Tax=Pseudocohnilembus persalinus TaxID=266149 RepID=A0A0V0QG37_PSEPJ|nr:hypothetical protein PPERSA_03694 [Pseudocohnilembus persalinus]|eukprot:KRX01190.1 hypothetical protein PPERSA_03694 [Pseudocohnilembus persalinus]